MPQAEWLDVALLYRQHHADLVRLALLLVGDRGCAEDVVQDVFTRPCARGLVLRQDSTLAYVRTAVVNGCRSVLRRRALARRVAVSRAMPWPETQDSAEHTAMLAEDRRQVLAALAGLPNRRREVLVLRFYLNLPVAEVAAILGISQGSVKSATARGLGALARRREDDEQSPGPADRRDERRGGHRSRRGVAPAHHAAAPLAPVVLGRPLAAAAAVVLAIGLAVSVSNGLFGAGSPAAWRTFRRRHTGTTSRPTSAPGRPRSGRRPPARSSPSSPCRRLRSKGPSRPRWPRLGTGRSTLPRSSAACAASRSTGSAHRGRARHGVRPGTGHAAPRVGSGRAGGVSRRLAGRGRRLLLPRSRAVRAAAVRPAHRDQHSHRGAKPLAGRVARARIQVFRVASLSWTGGIRELAVLGEWCKVASDPGGEGCPRWERQAQLRAINPPALVAAACWPGRLLLRQAPRTYLAQALASPDGSVITAMVLRGKIVGNPQISGIYPQNMSVDQSPRRPAPARRDLPARPG